MKEEKVFLRLSLTDKMIRQFKFFREEQISIRRMRKFYDIYPICSHFQKLIRVDRKEEREFYENESIKSNWGYRELGM